MKSASVSWSPPGRKAWEMFESYSRRSIILGPFASGKSATCCAKIMRHIHEQAPGPDGVRRSRWVAARNTYSELKLTTKKTWEDWFGHSEWGRIIEAAPFEHRMKFDMRDGTKVDAQLIFLALDRPDDARRLLSLELTGIWFNEIREMDRQLVESADGRLGRYPSMRDGGPTWFGLIGDTNMPDEDHWLHELAEVEKPKDWAFFKQPGGVIKQNGAWVENPEAENISNLIPKYYGGQLSGKSEQWISVYLGAEYGHIPDDGSYYAGEILQAERDKRVRDGIIIDPALPVHTAWDMGVAGNMVIVFFQAGAGEFKFVDYYECVEPGLPHAASVLREKKTARGWTYGTHLWPHDGNSTDIGSGLRRSDMMKSLGFDVVVLDRDGVGDGIEQVRRMLGMAWFDKNHVGAALNHMRRYRRKYDRQRSVWLDKPEKDGHDHCADAFRVAAMGQHKLSNNDNPAKDRAWEKVYNWQFEAA